MPAELDKAWALVNNKTAAEATFVDRVEMAVVKQAKAVRSGDAAPAAGQEALYAKRQALAVRVLSGESEAIATHFAKVLAVEASVTDNTTTDTVIQGRVQTNWNAVAGVWAQEGVVS